MLANSLIFRPYIEATVTQCLVFDGLSFQLIKADPADVLALLLWRIHMINQTRNCRLLLKYQLEGAIFLWTKNWRCLISSSITIKFDSLRRLSKIWWTYRLRCFYGVFICNNYSQMGDTWIGVLLVWARDITETCLNEKCRNRPRDLHTIIVYSAEQCYLIHLIILRRLSWPSLAYMCTKVT